MNAEHLSLNGDATLLSFEADMREVENILAVAQEWAERQNAHRDDCASLRLVLEELLVNLCLHASFSTGPAPDQEQARNNAQSAARYNPRNRTRNAEQKAEKVELRLEAFFSQKTGEDEADQVQASGPCGFHLTLRDSGQPFNPLQQRAPMVKTLHTTPVGGQGLALVRLLTTNARYLRLPEANVLTMELPLSRGGRKNGADTGQGGALPYNSAQGICPRAGFAVKLRDSLRMCPHFFETLWAGNLAIRQTTFFFISSLVLIWGGIGIYQAIISTYRLEQARNLGIQSLRTQDAISSTFLERIARSLQAFSAHLESLPSIKRIMADDDLFFEELRGGMLSRSLTAEIPVLGILKGRMGESGALLVYMDRGETKRRTLPFPFDALLHESLAGDSPIWAGPFYALPDNTGHPHAAMFIGVKISMAGKTHRDWIGAVITMPWIAGTLKGLSGFQNAMPVFMTKNTEYVIYPKGRSPYNGPQSLFEEARATGDPALARLADDVMRGGQGLADVSAIAGPKGLPWSVPWDGPTSFVYHPMRIPGWRFGLLVSAEELGSSGPPLPVSMLLLALFGPPAIGLLAWRVTSRALAPLRELASSLEQMGGGDLDTPLPLPRANDEISAMQRAFDSIRVTLRTSFANIEEKTARQQRIRNELALARSIQKSMLPVVFPEMKGVGIAAHIDIASEVCGDLYDCFELSENGPGKVYLLMGDICGKGIPASLLMSRTMTLARAALLDGDAPAQALSRLNLSLLRHGGASMFVTLLVGVLDSETGVFTWASAGHPPPIVSSAPHSPNGPGAESLPWTRELVLGVRADAGYTDHALHLLPGQSVLLYTDGADEAMGPPQGMNIPLHLESTGGLHIYGEERLTASFAAACRQCAGQDSESRVQTILELTRKDIFTHMGGIPAFDDISLMVISWTA